MSAVAIGHPVPITTAAAIRQLRAMLGPYRYRPTSVTRRVMPDERWMYEHVARLFPGIGDPGPDLVDTVAELKDELP